MIIKDILNIYYLVWQWKKIMRLFYVQRKGRGLRVMSPVNDLLIHFYSTNLQCSPKIMYIFNSFKGKRRFMSWALMNNRLILRPYNSDFLWTTTSFIPSWIIMYEMGVFSHKGRYSGHLKHTRLHITWQLAVLTFGARRARL